MRNLLPLFVLYTLAATPGFVQVPAAAATDIPLQDLAKLKVLRETSAAGGVVMYFSFAPLPELLDFYDEELGKSGWSRSSAQTDRMSYANVRYARGEETMTLSLGANKDAHPPEVLVNLTSQGTLSAKRLPRLEGSTPIYEDDQTALYRTDAAVAIVHAETRRLLEADGWAMDRETVAGDHRGSDWQRGNGKLSVSISIAPAQDNATVIQYAVVVLEP